MKHRASSPHPHTEIGRDYYKTPKWFYFIGKDAKEEEETRKKMYRENLQNIILLFSSFPTSHCASFAWARIQYAQKYKATRTEVFRVLNVSSCLLCNPCPLGFKD